MKIKELLLEWQQRLMLNDWVIKVYDNCQTYELTLRDVAGECEWEESKKSAVIRIITEKEYGDRIIPFDKEKILVHELLHIKFSFIQNSGNELQDRFVHQLINDMAVSLVAAKRKEVNV